MGQYDDFKGAGSGSGSGSGSTNMGFVSSESQIAAGIITSTSINPTANIPASKLASDVEKTANKNAASGYPGLNTALQISAGQAAKANAEMLSFYGAADYFTLDGNSNAAMYPSNNGSDANVTYPSDANRETLLCASFNGATSYISIPPSSAFELQPITIDFWIKISAAPASEQCIYSYGPKGSDSNGGGIRIAVNTLGKIVLYKGDNSGTYVTLVGTTALANGVWNHVTCSIDGIGNLTQTLAGVANGTTTSATAIYYSDTLNPNPPSKAFYIGAQNSTVTPPINFFAGKLSKLAIIGLGAIETLVRKNAASGYAGLDASSLLSLIQQRLNFKIGTFTRQMDAVSGNVSITGVGFTPRLVLIIGGTGGGVSGLTQGFSNGTNHYCTFSNAGGIAGAFAASTVNCIIFVETAANSQTATINSLDADGFTLTWTKNGTPAPTIVTYSYIAIR